MNRITIPLEGRIDSGNAAQVEETLRAQLSGKTVDAVLIDAAKLEYISSAGLRVILRLKKTLNDLTVENVSPEVYEIFEMTGFTELMTVKKAYRVVSVRGCEVVGEGQNGTIYRVDRDTVVKAYKNADALAEIQHEREVARLALILGVPTAISYDVVRVGDSYGSVFELLDCRSFAKILADEPERLDWCVGEFAGLLKKLHGIVVPAGKLPSMKASLQKRAARVRPLLPAAYGEKLARMIDEVPERDTMIHGDYHTKNIVLAGDEVLLIDMDTLSVGHPLFELAQMFCCFVGFGEYDSTVTSDFQGYSTALAREFWRRTLRAYLGTGDEEAVTAIENKLRCVAYARLIDWNTRHKDPGDKTGMAERELWTRELLELLDKVESLDFSVSPNT